MVQWKNKSKKITKAHKRSAGQLLVAERELGEAAIPACNARAKLCQHEFSRRLVVSYFSNVFFEL
jgi:hypothetical protein